MSDSTSSLQRKIGSATDLQSVVRTMKALAAASVGQYANSVLALADYCHAVELGLGVCFRALGTTGLAPERPGRRGPTFIGAVVFGSDQGLVGQFNDVVADYALKTLAALPGQPRVWAVGERVQTRLTDAGCPLMGLFSVPTSVQAITPLVGQIQIESEAHRARGEYAELYVFHNRPQSGALYEPVGQHLLPLDAAWAWNLAQIRWPTTIMPEVMGSGPTALRALIREYLFISLFRACAESLASEHASRLAAMERADKNIKDLLEDLQGAFHRVRQGGIDEELFEVVAGFEALSEGKSPKRGMAGAVKS
jgi:F-type H+-transporting ATPase subunit gamma